MLQKKCCKFFLFQTGDAKASPDLASVWKNSLQMSEHKGEVLLPTHYHQIGFFCWLHRVRWIEICFCWDIMHSAICQLSIVFAKSNDSISPDILSFESPAICFSNQVLLLAIYSYVKINYRNCFQKHHAWSSV